MVWCAVHCLSLTTRLHTPTLSTAPWWLYFQNSKLIYRLNNFIHPRTSWSEKNLRGRTTASKRTHCTTPPPFHRYPTVISRTPTSILCSRSQRPFTLFMLPLVLLLKVCLHRISSTRVKLLCNILISSTYSALLKALSSISNRIPMHSRLS